MKTSLTAPQLRTIQALAKNPTGLSSLALQERGVGSKTVVALVRAGYIFAGTSALSMTTQWHLTNKGRKTAVDAGFEVRNPQTDYRLLLANGESKPLAEARP
jgi:hypothetical protein